MNSNPSDSLMDNDQFFKQNYKLNQQSSSFDQQQYQAQQQQSYQLQLQQQQQNQQQVLTGLQQMSLPQTNNSSSNSSSVSSNSSSSEPSRLASRLSTSHTHQRLPSLSSLTPASPLGPNQYTATGNTPRQYRQSENDLNQSLKRHQPENLNQQFHPQAPFSSTGTNNQFKNPWFSQPQELSNPQQHQQQQQRMVTPNSASQQRLPPLGSQIPNEQFSPILMQPPTKTQYNMALPTTYEYDNMPHHQHQQLIIPPSRTNGPPPQAYMDDSPSHFRPDDVPRRQSVATGYVLYNHPPPPHTAAADIGYNQIEEEQTSGKLIYVSAPRFKRLRGRTDLHPVINPNPKYRRASSSNNFVSPLSALTTSISLTYSMCRPEFDYRSSKNPKRVLTKPSQPRSNNGNDNEDSDYILYVNDILGTQESKKYMVLDILGQGTFGQVVKCQNLKTQEIVAVKVVKSKPAYLKQSLTEANILEHLNTNVDPDDKHHFLRMLDKFIHKNHLCLVFELLSSNLYDLIRQNQFHGLQMKLIKKFTIQLLDSLAVLKDAKIIHCDLKPENILLCSLDKPNLKVIDFGSACHERQIVYTYIQSRFYRSPEVILGLSYTSSVDMWSLGCIIAELFLGLPLFPGTSEFNQLSRIIEMLGMPQTWMIEMGKNSLNFMNQVTLPNSKHQYSLKPIEQYSKEFNVSEDPGRAYFNHQYLNDIIMNYQLPKKNMGQSMIDKEMGHRKCLIHFLQGVLNLNPLERWTPHEAAMHPFVTDQQFHGYWNPPASNYNACRSNSTGNSNDNNKKQRSKSFGNDGPNNNEFRKLSGAMNGMSNLN